MEEEYSIIRNENPALVKGVSLEKGEEGGIVKDGEIRKKINAKSIPRVEVPTYKESVDNVPLIEKDPFSTLIKEKNDTARDQLIPLLNGMSRTDGIRLNAISLEVSKEIEDLEAEPVPDQDKIDKLKGIEDTIKKQKDVAEAGEKGIVFPPR
tara:strand:- start:751 stop:1206 length:456 start_codon:yes stop_codon:yes gene_type:complete